MAKDRKLYLAISLKVDILVEIVKNIDTLMRLLLSVCPGLVDMVNYSKLSNISDGKPVPGSYSEFPNSCHGLLDNSHIPTRFCYLFNLFYLSACQSQQSSMPDYSQLRDLCQQESDISGAVLDKFLLYYAAVQDKIDRQFETRISRFRATEREMPGNWKDLVKAQYIGH